MAGRRKLLDRLHAVSDRDAMEWFALAGVALLTLGWNGWNLAQHLIHGRIYVLDQNHAHWAYWSQEPRGDAVLIALACAAAGGVGLALLATMATLRMTRGRPSKPHETMRSARLDRL